MAFNFSRFFVKKSVELIHQEHEKSELSRSLSAFNLIALGLGCIIGAGIFVMTGVQSAVYAGPAILVSFVIAGVVCAFAALCYAELSSALPVSGSAYTYAYATLGELFAWVMGWLLILEYGIAASTVAVGWSGYFTSAMADFGIIIPESLKTATLHYNTDIAHEGLMSAITLTESFNVPAAGSILLLTFLLVIGIKESANVNNAIVVLKATILVLFVVLGFSHIDTANWEPFIPEQLPGTERYGWAGILHAGAVISFAYVGFEAVSCAAQEAKNPQRDMPIGILGSLAICTVLYMAVAAVLTGVVHYTDLDVPDPIAVAVDAINIGWLIWIVKLGAIVGLFSVILVLLYGQTRIFYTMGRDGLLPAMFARVHPKFKTPHLNTLFVGFLVAFVAGFTPIDILGDLVSLGTLMAFALVCFAVIYLRVTHPEIRRDFKVPLYPFVPALGMIACIWLMSGISNMVGLLFTTYMPIGLLVYFLYGYKHSKVNKS